MKAEQGKVSRRWLAEVFGKVLDPSESRSGKSILRRWLKCVGKALGVDKRPETIENAF